MANQDELLGQMSAVQQAPQAREISSDFLHNMTDVAEFRLSLRVKWCGWRIKEIPIINKGLGIEEKSIERSIEINYKTRIMNEDCCDDIAESMRPLITRAAQMSVATETMVYNLFRARIKEIKWMLAYNFQNGNSYELIGTDRIADVVSVCCTMILIASKSVGGKALQEVAESISSQTIGYAPMPQQMQQQPKAGLMQRVFGGARG